MPIDAPLPPAQQPFKTPPISWYPPHMYRAQKRFARELKNVDVVVEMRDARLPASSANPELDNLIGKRGRILLLNKTALANAKLTARWEAHFKARGIPVLSLDADSGKSLNMIYPLVHGLVAPAMQRLRERGIRPPPQRIMIAGMPNVGKSTLINRMVGGKKQRIAPEPGVTKGVSWIALKDKFLLMDTPGVLLPKFEDTGVALRLGWIGAIRDNMIGEERLALALIEYLLAEDPGSLAKQYDVDPLAAADSESMLESIGMRRGLLRRGGQIDATKAAGAVLGDFRRGALGRHTLEAPAQL